MVSIKTVFPHYFDAGKDKYDSRVNRNEANDFRKLSIDDQADVLYEIVTDPNVSNTWISNTIATILNPEDGGGWSLVMGDEPRTKQLQIALKLGEKLLNRNATTSREYTNPEKIAALIDLGIHSMDLFLGRVYIDLPLEEIATICKTRPNRPDRKFPEYTTYEEAVANRIYRYKDKDKRLDDKVIDAFCALTDDQKIRVVHSLLRLEFAHGQFYDVFSRIKDENEKRKLFMIIAGIGNGALNNLAGSTFRNIFFTREELQKRIAA